MRSRRRRSRRREEREWAEPMVSVCDRSAELGEGGGGGEIEDALRLKVYTLNLLWNSNALRV